MDFYGREYIEEFIDIEYENETYILAKIKGTEHLVRILYPYDEEDFGLVSVCLQFGNKETFDRWANSVDFERKIIDYHEECFRSSDGKIRRIEEDIKESVELANILFDKIPTKYWGNFLRVSL